MFNKSLGQKISDPRQIVLPFDAFDKILQLLYITFFFQMLAS